MTFSCLNSTANMMQLLDGRQLCPMFACAAALEYMSGKYNACNPCLLLKSLLTQIALPGWCTLSIMMDVLYIISCFYVNVVYDFPSFLGCCDLFLFKGKLNQVLLKMLVACCILLSPQSSLATSIVFSLYSVLYHTIQLTFILSD